MTTYRLPDGTEATAVPNMTVTHVGYAWVQHPQLGVMQIAGSLLTEVKPPLPPEPPRDGTPWYDPTSNEIWRGLGDGWYGHGADFCHRWSEVCGAEYADPSKWVRLVPDPADDPALVERVAQAMRDANASQEWERPWQVPFDHFAKVAVDTIRRAAREVSK